MEERAALVWERGCFLATRYEKEQPIDLYYMESIFAEIWHTHIFRLTSFFGFFYKQSTLSFIRAFNNPLNLEPYQKFIDLPKV